MRHLHANVYKDSNGDIVMIIPESMFSNKKKIVNLTELAKDG